MRLISSPRCILMPAGALLVDADNRLLWHKSVRRLDAEQYRDSLLVAMDTLDASGRWAECIRDPAEAVALLAADAKLWRRDARPRSTHRPGLVGTAKRDVTTTAPQSLMMINSPRIMGVAKQFAARIRADLAGYRVRSFWRGVCAPSPLGHRWAPRRSRAIVDLLAPLVLRWRGRTDRRLSHSAQQQRISLH